MGFLFHVFTHHLQYMLAPCSLPFFLQNTTASPFPGVTAWLPISSSSTEVTWLWSLPVMQHAGTELWLPLSCSAISCGRAAAHSLANHSCLRYLLRVLREKKHSAARGPSAVYPIHTFQGMCKNCKLCIQTRRFPPRQFSIVPQSLWFLGFVCIFFSCLFARQNL